MNEAGSVGNDGQERMRSPGKGHIGAIAGLALTIGLVITRGAADAQQAVRTDAAWLDCQKIAPDVGPALDAARRLLNQTWLEHQDRFYAAYTMPGEKRNPFDLSPRAPDSGPRDGFVEARPPRCMFYTSSSAGPTLHIRFTTAFYRFHEEGPGWSPPLRKGLMLDVVVTRGDSGWQAAAPPSEQTILLPEQAPKRPDAARLPPDAPWAEPIPGCGKRERWNGTECVSRQRR